MNDPDGGSAQGSTIDVHRGEGPLVATAVHDGHAVRRELQDLFALGEAERLREEDPFTGEWTAVAPTRVLARRSRFEVDLNRPREKAVYRQPDDAWGLKVWNRDLPDEMVRRSLDEYDAFYEEMRVLLGELEERHGRFVVFDLHSYNHRRAGRDAPAADPEANPQVNVGTGSMDRERYAPVVDGFIEALRAQDFLGGHLDVRENVKFQGGNWPQWIHRTFPGTGIAVAIEFKKFFMDEWSGQPDRPVVDAITAALRATVPTVLERLQVI